MTPAQKAQAVFPDQHRRQRDFLEGCLIALRNWDYSQQHMTLVALMGFEWVRQGRR